MVGPGHLGDMVDMVGDLRQGDRRRGMLAFPLRQRRRRLVGLADVQPAVRRRAQQRLLARCFGGPMAIGVRNINLGKVDHHHAAVGRHQLEHLVRDIARMIVERAGAGMREDHRRAADAQGVAHRGFADMRQIDQHAQPVEFVHHGDAERRQPAMQRNIGRRIRPCNILDMGQRQITRAQLVIGAQHRQIGIDLAAAFDPDQ